MSLDVAELTVPATYVEDSDSWLDVSPDELDGLLSRSAAAAGTTQPVGEDAEAEAQAQTLGELAKKVGQFVEGEGDLEGARFEEWVLAWSTKRDGTEALCAAKCRTGATFSTRTTRAIPGRRAGR